jgi:hypothetical protein
MRLGAQIRLPWLLLLWLIAGSFVNSGTPIAAAEQPATGPTAITLSYFRAVGQASTMLIEWRTETEFQTAGFFVRRSTGASGDFTDPGIGFIPASGGELSGTTYSVVDSNVVVGDTYWYKLIEIEINGTENEFGPVVATVGVTPTPTPELLASPGAATATPLPTSTGFPTSTPVPTQATVTPTPRSTTVATATASGTLPPTPTPTRTPISVAGNATATPFAFPTPTSSAGLEANVVEAADDPTPGAGYPGPADEPYPGAPTPVPDTSPVGYPPADAAATAPPLPTPADSTGYPATGDSSESLPSLNQGAAEDAAAEVSQGRTLLWAGFVVALVVFAAGIYSAIIYYNRRPAGRS